MTTPQQHRPYKCTVQLSLPSNQYAHYLKDIISVDKEISDKVVKSFSVVDMSSSRSSRCRIEDSEDDNNIGTSGSNSVEVEGTNSNEMRVLQM